MEYMIYIENSSIRSLNKTNILNVLKLVVKHMKKDEEDNFFYPIRLLKRQNGNLLKEFILKNEKDLEGLDL